MFAQYPNGLTHFTRECFPEGFTIDRTVRFEGDGTMTSHHSYELDGSNITTHVTLTCDGFDPNGAVMKDELVDILTTESHIYPCGDNAVRQLCTIVSLSRPHLLSSARLSSLYFSFIFESYQLMIHSLKLGLNFYVIAMRKSTINLEG